MHKITVIVDEDTYLGIMKTKIVLQKEKTTENITFTDAINFVLKKGLEHG